MQKSKFLTILFTFLFAISTQAQNCSLTDTLSSQKKTVNIPSLIAVGTITPAILTGMYVYMHNAWWSESQTDFHFDDGIDLKYALNLDKLGHFTASIIASNAFTDILQTTGVQRKNAIWWGASLSIVNATIIEIKDGYAPYWGFSMYDEIANIAGAFYPVLQEKVPFFQAFNFKWSYDINYSYETEYYKYRLAHDKLNSKGKPEGYSFIDDYDRQYFWLTIDWATLFCKDKPRYKLPYCIDLALGVSGENLKTEDPNKKIQRKFYIGFDINLTKFFKKKNIPYHICKYLNFYHLPLPAAQVSPKAKGYWLMY